MTIQSGDGVEEQDCLLWPSEFVGRASADPDCQPEDGEELLVLIESSDILAASFSRSLLGLHLASPACFYFPPFFHHQARLNVGFRQHKESCSLC